MPTPSPRIGLVADSDPSSAVLLERLLRNGVRALPLAHRDGEFAFTLAGAPQRDGGWRLHPRGTSARYTAITALGLMRLPETLQRQILSGEDCHDLVGRLAKRLDTMANLGDVALVCWAAAEAEHSELPHALHRLADIDRAVGRVEVVAAAWVVSALVAARPHCEVEPHLAAARRRLLAARSAVYPHATGGSADWYRSHVGSFADQVYPVQALARLHASGGDSEALAAANAVASAFCRAQGDAGQWWWHYDSRTGAVVEGYPVYSVHQHAMAPMALLDLAEAGGTEHLAAICRGLQWLARPPETRENLTLGQLGIVWRKVARADRGKTVRGLRAAATRLRPGLRLSALDRLFPPCVVDHECRPYELGWLLYTWLAAGANA
ncbi:MAG TPA: hypothetical protein VIV12_01135 [Streptosporangiaceae bacterium]